MNQRLDPPLPLREQPAETIDFREALAQDELFITTITYNLPQIIMIIADDDRHPLYSNFAASILMSANPGFLAEFTHRARSDGQRLATGCAIEFTYTGSDGKQYYTVTAYPLLWDGLGAKAYVINNISDQRGQPPAKKTRSYQDELTSLRNRLSGIMHLNKWLDAGNSFVLLLVNLDNLKYINNNYGKREGDRFIVESAACLAAFSPGTIASRISGDEFLLLVPDLDARAAECRMKELGQELQARVEDQPYYSSMSHCIVAVEPGGNHSASALLELADGKMQVSKLQGKRERMIL